MDKFRFSLTQRVKFYETDLQTVMHHSEYFKYFETARVEYMRNLGLIKKGDFVGSSTVTVVKTLAVFNFPLKFDDEFKINVRISDLKRTNMTFEYRINRADDNRLIATGLTKVAAIDRKSYKPTRIPPVMVDKITAFEKLPGK